MFSRNTNFHEDLRRSEEARGSSNRNFGLVFTVFLALVGLAPLRSGGHIRIPALVGSGLFLAVSLFWPGLLQPLNKAWTWIGLILGKIVNPIVTAILFFLVFAPVGIVMRLLGKDPLHLKLAPAANSYWIARNPPGPLPDTMAKQF